MSEVSIANLALARLGNSQLITALSDSSNPARLCNRFYSQCRKEVLRAFPWPFAMRSVALAQVAGETFPGWEYLYQYPSGCLSMRYVGDESGVRVAQTYLYRHDWMAFGNLVRRYPFTLMNRADGNIGVLSDIAGAYGFYTVDIVNAGVFPADFESVVAWRLAMEVGGPLQADRARIADARAQYALAMREASAAAFNEGTDDRVPESDSIACRM